MRHSKYLKAVLLLMSGTFLFLHSCKHEDKPGPSQDIDPEIVKIDPEIIKNDMVLYWNEKTSLVLASPMPQPRRARLFAITQIAVHDALNSIKPKFATYALTNAREQFADPDAAVASAAYWVIKKLNLQGNQPIDSWFAESLAMIQDSPGKELGKSQGLLAAEAIITNRLNDGLAQEIASSPNPPDGDDPGEYRSTLPYADPALNLPHIKLHTNWGQVIRPFVLDRNDRFRPSGPHAVNSEWYGKEFAEVKTKGGRLGHTRTQEEADILAFWTDIRPSLIWNQVARTVIKTKNVDAWKTARIFALLHTAMADGNNGVMEAKYHFYSWRPETAIRLGSVDDNPSTAGDPEWLPSLIAVPNSNPVMHVFTPPLPEYPSSFSMHGGAATQILKLCFGTDNISFDLTGNVRQTGVRHYDKLSLASAENTTAWIYAGFYFRKAVVDGEEQGRQIATYVFNNGFREN